MGEFSLVDTFPDYLEFWQQAKARPQAEQITAWSDIYMDAWPELRQKQFDSYVEDGLDWREAAGEYIFPHLADYLPAMKTAHAHLPSVAHEAYRRDRETIGFDVDLVCVIYVGIGCGAGWATTYAGQPAILFGLENIAAEGWQGGETLLSLAAHELGHLAHFHWRDAAGIASSTGPWWQLYSEGVAQYIEGVVQGGPSWHMQAALGHRWPHWCRENAGWLATEFLRRVDQGQDIRPFFGSWYELRGYKQTGYFLGQLLIEKLSAQMSLSQIALLEAPEMVLRPLLHEVEASH